MSKTILTDKFWRKFCMENIYVNSQEDYQVWFFSNNRESAKLLVDLVLQGGKKATASLALINEMKPEIAPIPFGYSVITDFDGNPQCVIQTTEIRHLPFIKVDPQFAFDEGEGDQSLEFWRNGHREYFSQECSELGIEFDESMLIACERFDLLFPKANR